MTQELLKRIEKAIDEKGFIEIPEGELTEKESKLLQSIPTDRPHEQLLALILIRNRYHKIYGLRL